MPQMYPISWIFMFIFFSTSFILFLSQIYFTFQAMFQSTLKEKHMKKKMFSWNMCW